MTPDRVKLAARLGLRYLGLARARLGGTGVLCAQPVTVGLSGWLCPHQGCCMPGRVPESAWGFVNSRHSIDVYCRMSDGFPQACWPCPPACRRTLSLSFSGPSVDVDVKQVSDADLGRPGLAPSVTPRSCLGGPEPLFCALAPEVRGCWAWGLDTGLEFNPPGALS